MLEGKRVELIKCPACGASNSARRQICHLCGQMLSALPDKSDAKDSLHLISEELKAAAEAAIREAGRGPGRSSADAEPRSISQEDKPRESTSRGRRESPRKSKRERTIVFVLAAVTLVALVFIIYSLIPKSRGGQEVIPMPGTPVTSGAPAVVYPGTGAPPAAGPTWGALPSGLLGKEQKPKVEKPEPETSEEPSHQAAPAPEEPQIDAGALVAVSISAIRPQVTAITARINKELGSNISVAADSYRGTLSQQGNETAVATVIFQGNGVSGTINILLHKYDQGWRSGWRPTHFKDLELTFSPPLTIRGSGEMSETARTSAQIGAGLYEPLASLADLPIEYSYD